MTLGDVLFYVIALAAVIAWGAIAFSERGKLP